MRKEVFFALFLGSLVGIGFGFLMWKLNKKESSLPQKLTTIITQPFQTPQPSATPGLSLTEPTQSLMQVSPVTLKGSFYPHATLFISSDTKDTTIPVNDNGTFAYEFEPLGGINSFQLSAFTPQSAQIQTTFVYSTEVLKNEGSPSAKPSIDPVRENIAKKLENSEVPIATYGKVTEKTETGIQIEKDTSEIIQAIVAPPDTKFIRVRDNKEIKFEELGLGDYVAILGFHAGTGIINTKRVLIDSKPDFSNRIIKQGTVKDSKRTQFTFASDQEYTIKSSTQTKIYTVTNGEPKAISFSGIKDGQKVVTIGRVDGTTLTPRSIFILE